LNAGAADADRPILHDLVKPCNSERGASLGSMLRAVGAVVCGAALATGAAAVAAPPGAEGSDWASASLSNVHAGARPVALVVSLHTELQCGKLRGSALALTFPASAKLPRTVPASAIAVQGKQPSSVKLVNRTLSMTLPRPIGVMCNVLAPGTAKILLSRAALLGNPASPGVYTLAVQYGMQKLQAPLKIVS
jgi:hypothetical protein